MNRLLFKIYNEENAHYYLENTGKIQKKNFPMMKYLLNNFAWNFEFKPFSKKIPL